MPTISHIALVLSGCAFLLGLAGENAANTKEDMMIDIALLLLGAAGALITVYLVKQTPIPEFRPLFDTTQSEVDAGALRDHIQKTKKDIDDLQGRLRQELISADLAQRLKEVIDTSQRELELEQAELKGLERQI